MNAAPASSPTGIRGHRPAAACRASRRPLLLCLALAAWSAAGADDAAWTGSCTSYSYTGLSREGTLAVLQSSAPPPAPAAPDQLRRLELAQRWNGEVSWAPASAPDARALPRDPSPAVTRAGDEARAVLGPIPHMDCGGPASRGYRAEVDGNVLDVECDAGGCELVHRDLAGQVVARTPETSRCDKPSLAGGTTFCGTNSRIVRVARGNVEWVTLCRKAMGAVGKLEAAPYWLADNPEFALLGTIGFNASTGEVAFFDGVGGGRFDWSAPFVPPGGDGYDDTRGRERARRLYDHAFAVDCHDCHDNKEPWVMAPHITHARIGYGDKRREQRFGIGELLPARPRLAGDPYRVIGTGYVTASRDDGNVPVELGTYPNGCTVADPVGTCTGCHTLTTLNTGRVFAHDAVGRRNPGYSHMPDTLPTPAHWWDQLEASRTAWSRGAGNGHPWMVPLSGGNTGGDPPPPAIDDDHWAVLATCLNGAGDAELCGYRRLFTECPAPESAADERTRLADPAGPTHIALDVDGDSGDAVFPRRARLTWRYLNTLGGVPERDDVRFNVAVREVDMPDAAREPTAGEYPTAEQLAGDRLAVDGELLLVPDISYAGHARFTEPYPAVAPRDYRALLPARCGKRYLVSLLAKRFCFDGSSRRYGAVVHRRFVDVECPP